MSGIHNWFAGEIASAFAAAFETMTGESCTATRAPRAEPLAAGLYWQQKFSGAAGALWIAAAEADWTAGGASVVRAAGLAESDPAKLKSEYFEIVGQACSGLARAISARLDREVACDGGGESAAPSGEIAWITLEVRVGAAAMHLMAGVDAKFLGNFQDDMPRALESPKPAFDLLLDVELPVSVSFGRAQIPLKDLLKLTTGSIVELNRAIGDPVEVIVNNCVIARGEVVVVEGNFGVRIQQVISRQERLRTLN
ncbi:MAG: flagellar motor switch protein FliN [Bryobacteraceae bacterium]